MTSLYLTDLCTDLVCSHVLRCWGCGLPHRNGGHGWARSRVFHTVSVLAACSPPVTWISSFPSSCRHLEAPAPLRSCLRSKRLDASHLTPAPPAAPHAHAPPRRQVPVFFACSECLGFFLSLKIVIGLIFHAFLLFLKESSWPCGLWPSPPAFIEPGTEGLPSPCCSARPPVFLLHLVTFAPLFFSRCLNISPPLLPHGPTALLGPAITASHVPIYPGPATHPSVSLWVGVSSPPLCPGAVPPSPSEHLHQPCEQVSQKRGAVPCHLLGGSAEAEDPGQSQGAEGLLSGRQCGHAEWTERERCWWIDDLFETAAWDSAILEGHINGPVEVKIRVSML